MNLLITSLFFFLSVFISGLILWCNRFSKSKKEVIIDFILIVIFFFLFWFWTIIHSSVYVNKFVVIVWMSIIGLIFWFILSDQFNKYSFIFFFLIGIFFFWLGNNDFSEVYTLSNKNITIFLLSMIFVKCTKYWLREFFIIVLNWLHLWIFLVACYHYFILHITTIENTAGLHNPIYQCFYGYYSVFYINMFADWLLKPLELQFFIECLGITQNIKTPYIEVVLVETLVFMLYILFLYIVCRILIVGIKKLYYYIVKSFLPSWRNW